MKFFAPYKRFRVVVNGIKLYFPTGSRFVEDDNTREIEAIKHIPIELGKITNAAGECVNCPKPKPTKPIEAPEGKTKTKAKKSRPKKAQATEEQTTSD